MGKSCFDDVDAKNNEINTPSPAMSPNISRNILLCIMSQFLSQLGAEWGEDKILGLLSSNNAIGPPNHNLIRDEVVGEGVANGVLALQSSLLSVISKMSTQGSSANAFVRHAKQVPLGQ